LRDAAGIAVGIASGLIGPGGVVSLDARPVTFLATAGSVEVSHDGEPQALIGSQTTLSVPAGLSFDTVMFERKRW